MKRVSVILLTILVLLRLAVSAGAADAPRITKDPGDEIVELGANCVFTVGADNSHTVIWHFGPETGREYLVSDSQQYFPTLWYYLHNSDRMLELVNIPAELSGWRFCAEFRGPGGDAWTASALLTVRGLTNTSAPQTEPETEPEQTEAAALQETAAAETTPIVGFSPVGAGADSGRQGAGSQEAEVTASEPESIPEETGGQTEPETEAETTTIPAQEPTAEELAEAEAMNTSLVIGSVFFAGIILITLVIVVAVRRNSRQSELPEPRQLPQKQTPRSSAPQEESRQTEEDDLEDLEALKALLEEHPES